jgi:signal transduction histidine kinase
VVVPVATASRGLVIVAGEEPIDDDPLRRAALVAGAARIGTILDAVRMRDNLERAMAQILATDERMLGRMGLDIHDGPTQQLSVALLEVQLLQEDVAQAAADGEGLPESLNPALDRIYETVGGALHEMRELIGQLRPAQFEDRSLKDILNDALVSFGARADCEVEAEFAGAFPVNGVSITQRITFFRILQETLSNAHRHGQARRVRVRLSEHADGTALEVRDDGKGFDPEAVQRRKPGMPLARFGLHGMRDRAQILGGTFEAVSTPGEGATIRVFLPRWDGPAPEVAVDAA